ncbi:MAG: RrF2 family transcriptional regulator [Thermodesulfobacteriota bacterium]
MRLSKKAQYGTRAMLELALNHGRGVVSLSHVARQQGISLKYLEQLIRPLRRAGIVEGTRGATGGYRLTRSPSQISVGEVIRALEEPMNPVECLDDTRLCERSGQCRARGVWAYLSHSIQRTLDAITLDDILMQQDPSCRADGPFDDRGEDHELEREGPATQL